jgi:hypothetical protein
MQSQDIEIYVEPGVGNALSYGWQQMKANFLIFFLAVFVVAILESPLAPNEEPSEVSTVVGLILFAYWLLFLPVMEYGADLIFLRGVRGDEVDIKSIAEGFSIYLNVILARLLVVGLVGIALVVFIIPGIFVATRLAFVSYLVMDEGLDPIEAVEASWRITSGHGWKIFGLGCVSMLLGLVGFLLLVCSGLWVFSCWSSIYSLPSCGRKLLLQPCTCQSQKRFRTNWMPWKGIDPLVDPWLVLVSIITTRRPAIVG